MARTSGRTLRERLVSNNSVCPVCNGNKPLGALVCWSCRVRQVGALQRHRKIRALGLRLIRDDDGATLIEYTVLLSLMLVGTVGTIGTVGTWASNEWIKIDQALTGDPPSNNNGGGTNNGGSGGDPPPSDPPPPFNVAQGQTLDGIICGTFDCPMSNSVIYSAGLPPGTTITSVPTPGTCFVKNPFDGSPSVQPC